MVITPRVLNRSTLARQLLLAREPIGVEDAVRRVVALQAQRPGSPYVALWNRIADFAPERFDEALNGFRVVRSTLMRLTLHQVHADDYRAFREAMEPTLRGGRLHDPRFRAAGFTAADADALLPGLLAHAAEARTGAELRELVERGRSGPVAPVVWRMVRQYAPLWHAPTGPPWSFGTAQSFVAAAERPVLADPEASAAGLAVLLRRYLEGFGPASVADMAQFTTAPRRLVREAVRTLEEGLVRLEGADGTVLYDVPGAPLPDAETPAPPRLLAMWDSVLLAYADRSRIIPPAYRRHVIRVNGDTLPALLVDGYVAGVWRPVGGGIEVSAFHPLPAGAWEGLAAEASALGGFLPGRDPLVYRRYDHWWAKGFPAVETRVLPAG
ncbi:winged helix DNA-binding domain-containing protein [Streptomyces sp. WAC08241]|uniref:winged helix DNA-binding domain-containing protein n=1 Tax=Streptomyces sp. WAC08241 TaxID=2487421 RepID=UPI000F79AB5F|nr:winged helix DNA-binding domain-containing protein [Streptomyces sp. WAC08241]RSS39414.1 winged helix DNA-binding domain-containing protein [Streptomyces sp. WAC08241]